MRDLSVAILFLSSALACLSGMGCLLGLPASGPEVETPGVSSVELPSNPGPDSNADPARDTPSDPSDTLGDDAPVVGRPASFQITLAQGEGVLFSERATISDSDPLSADEPVYYRIVEDYGYYGGRSNASVYLDVSVSSPDEALTNVHFAIRAAKRTDHRKKSNHPLFVLNPLEGICLSVSDLRFEHNGHPRCISVFHYPYGTRAAAAYMLHYGEYDASYYRLPGAVLFDVGPDNKTLQVPQSAFMNTDEVYWFEEGSGLAPTVAWADMTSPDPDATGGFPVLTTDGTPGLRDGEVFELGVSAVVWLTDSCPAGALAADRPAGD